MHGLFCDCVFVCSLSVKHAALEADEYDLMSQWQRSHRSLGIRSLQGPEQEVTASDLSRKTRVRAKRELCAHSHKPQQAESLSTHLCMKGLQKNMIM